MLLCAGPNRLQKMQSYNAVSADNQQERLSTAWWIVGFVDGEGCFSVTIQKNAKMSLGWQVFPEFVVSQRKSNRKSLEAIKKFFGCGEIYANTRTGNHREDMLRYCVRSVSDLVSIIVPFFQNHPLQTNKKSDFLKFTKVLEKMRGKEHLTQHGLGSIARLTQTMNRKCSSRYLESSETKRQTHKVRR